MEGRQEASCTACSRMGEIQEWGRTKEEWRGGAYTTLSFASARLAGVGLGAWPGGGGGFARRIAGRTALLLLPFSPPFPHPFLPRAALSLFLFFSFCGGGFSGCQKC